MIRLLSADSMILRPQRLQTDIIVRIAAIFGSQLESSAGDGGTWRSKMIALSNSCGKAELFCNCYNITLGYTIQIRVLAHDYRRFDVANILLCVIAYCPLINISFVICDIPLFSAHAVFCS